MSAPAAPPVRVLQTVLAGEHAASWLYGVLGGRTSQSATPALFATISAAYAAHRARRDRLVAEITDLGAEPVAAAVAYELPPRLRDAATTVTDVLATARTIEERCAATYSWAVAGTTGAWRRLALDALTESAVRVLSLDGRPEDFPGMPERG
jgi:hypothetical protein